MKTFIFKFLFLLFYISFSSLAIYAQPEIWGLTSSGGQYGGGNLFKTDMNGENPSIEYEFFVANGMSPYYTKLCEASNGKLYGLTYYSRHGGGILFEYDPLNNKYSIGKDLIDEIDGQYPKGSLMQASDGKLYGMTSYGGLNNKGVIFEFDPFTYSYNVIHNFNGTDGERPYGGLIQASNGKLYGMTYQGGTSGKGVIFEYDIYYDIYTKIYDFTSNYSNPNGDLYEASDGKLYGLTCNHGLLFSYDYVTDNFTILYTFFSNPNSGEYPYGSLIEGSVGKLYGLTEEGPVYTFGSLFEYDFINDSLRTVFCFNNNPFYGCSPYGSLEKAANGKLYGLTSNVGPNYIGTIFEYDPINDTLIKIFDFNNITGGEPLGTLLYASNGKFYGLTNTGASEGYGSLFEYDLISDTCINKVDFGSYNDGKSCDGSLFYASNKKLYGATTYGGDFDKGVFFEFDPLTKNYIRKFSFSDSLGSWNYELMQKSGTLKLYGTCKLGGQYNKGVIFEYDLGTDEHKILHHFNDTNGALPTGLIEANNGNLYGMTYDGGGFGSGVIYEFNPSANIYSVLWDCTNQTGSHPNGHLTEVSNGIFYGLTRGETNYGSKIFEYNSITDTLIVKFSFSTATGKRPQGSLIKADDGLLYAVAGEGGNNNKGSFFKYDYINNVFTKIFDFNSTSGEDPKGTCIQTSSGNILGMTQTGGVSDLGTVFRYNISNQTFTPGVTQFNGIDGAYPYFTQLIEICPDRMFYDTIPICQGDSIFVGGAYQSIPGTYTDTLISICGSDSVIYSVVLIEPIYNFNDSITICNGDSIFWHGSSYYNGGVYYDSLTTQCGLDSVYKLNLTVYSSYDTTIYINICSGDSILWEYEYYSTTGVYNAHYFSDNYCDSVRVLNLTVNPVYYFIENGKICPGDSLYLHDLYFDSPGVYTINLSTISACDSVYETHLTIDTAYYNYEAYSFCEDETWHAWHGQPLTATGLYTDSNITVCGFDSIYYFDVTVNTLPGGFTIYGSTTAFVGTSEIYSVSENDSVIYYWNFPGTADGIPSYLSNDSISFLFTLPGYILIDVDPVSLFGCEGESEYLNVNVLPTNIDEVNDETVYFYPNPTKGEIFIIGDKVKKIEIINNLGEVIISETDDRIIDIKDQPSGIFIIKIVTDKKTITKKLIKM